MKPRMKKKTVSRLSDSSGFTLIELVLATLISMLVVGIMSVCLSFVLRVWESTQNRRPDQSRALVDLLKNQLSEFDPTPIKLTEGPHSFFTGDAKSIAFATSRSVKAISKGVPVVARYAFDPKNKVLFYAEMPLDVYHPKLISEFMQAKPALSEKGGGRFHKVELDNFALSYGVKEGGRFQDNWEQASGSPVSVLLNWNTNDGTKFAQLLIVNSPFSIPEDLQPKPFQTPGGGSQ